MNHLIEIGIVFIAIGTFITYLGSKKDNDNSQKTLVDKINDFNNQLNEVKNERSSDLDKASKLDELTSEFDNWAIDLKENYPEMKLSYNRLELEFSEKELKANKEWKPFYLEIFSNIEKMIVSINKELDPKSKIVLIKRSSFPQSIFDNTEPTLDWILKFDENSFWNIRLYRFNMKNDILSLPDIEIRYEDNIKKAEDVIVPKNFIRLIIISDSIKCEVKGKFKYIDIDNFSNELSIENINNILKTCFQYQLVQSNS